MGVRELSEKSGGGRVRLYTRRSTGLADEVGSDAIPDVAGGEGDHGVAKPDRINSQVHIINTIQSFPFSSSYILLTHLHLLRLIASSSRRLHSLPQALPLTKKHLPWAGSGQTRPP